MRTLAIMLCAVAGFVALAPQTASACPRGQYWDGANCVVKLNGLPQFRPTFNAPRVHKIELNTLPRAPGVKVRHGKVFTPKFNTPPRLHVSIKKKKGYSHSHY